MNLAIFPGREGEEVGGGREWSKGQGDGREEGREFTIPFGCARRRDVTSSTCRYCSCQTPASRDLFSHYFRSRAVLCKRQDGAPNRKPTDSEGGTPLTELELEFQQRRYPGRWNWHLRNLQNGNPTVDHIGFFPRTREAPSPVPSRRQRSSPRPQPDVAGRA
jgi:hypothetical protein